MPKKIENAKRSSHVISARGAHESLEIRPLTEAEIERLEQALGKPIDRQYLTYWVSTAISDVVRLSTLLTAREFRTDFMRMAREGRQWIREVSAYPNVFVLRVQEERDHLIEAADAFCNSLDILVARAARSIRAGQPRTHFAYYAFLEYMIGIAKRARVLPSTPQRAIPPQKPAPAFFQFVRHALTISREVIETSPVPDDRKSAALMILKSKRESALIKAIENLRGRIGDYREGTIGLVETDQSLTGK